MMLFQPKVKDFVIAHPVPLLFLWLPLAGFLAYRFNQNWARFDDGDRTIVMLIFMVWAALLLVSAPKVWWHLYQKRKHTLAGIDPEIVSQQRRKKLNIILSLLAVGLFEYVISFLNSHTESENPAQYMTAVGLAGSLSLLPFVLFYRSRRSWSSYLFLALLTIAGSAGLWHIYHPAEFLDTYPELLGLFLANSQLSYYLILTAFLCTVVPPLIVLMTLAAKAGSWLKTHTDKPVSIPDKPFAVTWCLPIPRHSPDATAAVLPDYCKQVLMVRPKPAVTKTYSTAEMSVLTSKQTGTQKPAA